MRKQKQSDKLLCSKKTGVSLDKVEVIAEVFDNYFASPKASPLKSSVKKELLEEVRVKFGVTSWFFAPYLWFVAKAVISWMLQQLLEELVKPEPTTASYQEK